jgi:hypothetical protein
VTSTPEPLAPSALPGDRSRRATGIVAGVLALLLGVLLVVEGARVARLPADQIVSWNVIIDDGFYYLQVARNLARGHGSTFDRVNVTNGYQPLWGLALTPLFWFAQSPESGMRAALVLAAVLSGLALLCLYLGLARLLGCGVALLTAALIVANPYFLQILQGGLETPILFLSLAALVALLALWGERVLAGERRACLLLGVVLGLTVLSRVDVALILAPIALVPLVLGGGSLRARLARAALIAAPALALILPFVLYSLATQGTPMPVSGLVKRWVAETYQGTEQLFVATEQWRGLTRSIQLLAWPHVMPEPPSPAAILPALKLPGLLLALAALRLLWSRRARRNRLAASLLLAATLGAAAHALYLYFGYRSTGHWNYHYFFPAALLFTVLACSVAPLLVADLGLLLDRILGGRLRPRFAAVGAALCLLPAGYLLREGLPAFEKRFNELRRPPGESFRKSRYDAARFLREHFPREAVFGAWWAGTVGYLSDRRVVNLDGVINSAAFFREQLRRDRVPAYLLEGPVRHLVDFFWRDPLHPSPPSWRAMWWEHEKEHVVAKLRGRLRLVQRFPFRGDAGMYLYEIVRR